jgi:hypothetical protein
MSVQLVLKNQKNQSREQSLDLSYTNPLLPLLLKDNNVLDKLSTVIYNYKRKYKLVIFNISIKTVLLMNNLQIHLKFFYWMVQQFQEIPVHNTYNDQLYKPQ